MILYKGEKIPEVSPSHLVLGEIDAVERALGLNFPRIQRLLETCVCDHGRKAHLDKNNELAACRLGCDCEQFLPDVPTRLTLAFMWVSIKRVRPTETFDDILAASSDDLEEVDDPEQVELADPTRPADEPDQPETPSAPEEPATSL